MSITFYSNDSLLPDGKPKFLGTTPGDGKNGRQTYFCKYQPSGDSDAIRYSIHKTLDTSQDVNKIKKISNHSFTPFTPLESQLRRNYDTLSVTLERGVFFKLKKLGKTDKKISSLEYVTRILKSQLEFISSLPVEELFKQFSAYGHDYLVHYCFKPIDFPPKDGDLVVYSEKIDFHPHYGIFRESNSNKNFPNYGIIESKWNSPYVFLHELFFVPSSFGDKAQFYRVREKKVNLETLAITPHLCPVLLPNLRSNTTYTILGDGSLIFNTTKENIERRKIADKYKGDALAKKLPEIENLSYIKFHGFCQDYVFGRTLSSYRKYKDMPEPQIYGNQILEKYFTVTTAPQKGDLVVYYNWSIEHWGIYLDGDRVESKWGLQQVYRHRLFDVPEEYGNTIKCFRLKDGLTVKQLTVSLKQDLQILKSSRKIEYSK